MMLEETKVNRYFTGQVEKVFVERGSCVGIETFKQYLSHKYLDNCYWYSTYAIMGLNSNDYLIRGTIDFPDWKEYEHGWVEFTYQNQEYVFDNLIGILSKEQYYKKYQPKVNYKKTQREILQNYLTKDRSICIKKRPFNCVYQIINLINNNDETFISNAIRLARIEIFLKDGVTSFKLEGDYKITRFLAYDELRADTITL